MTPTINTALPSHITPNYARRASSHHLRIPLLLQLGRYQTPHRLQSALTMSSRLTDRTEPTVIPRAHASTRSRLPPILRIPILVVLNLGLKSALWSFVSNFLNPELGAISKVPSEADFWSLYSPGARLLMNGATIWMNWYFNYDCKAHVVVERSLC
ncbi:MAG: hypothetical protein EOO38_21895 [Cytophagaceae bacterium]|nr:MAG: hypothetical protein EOO38_21895 [Cytophagaceae bacterium]